ncbi:DUF1062 domain-containing protein [Streptomyces sp. NPDC005955]|uniref:DUF1062 domain-containing protein n=1 Tax=Streptomyces sp. NPDC005955 TaxID=3364738 RepID=UPI0036B687BA
MSKNWVVVPTCPPIVLRRCHRCPSGRFRTSGKFRVNAHHKLLDAWLLARCTECGDTTKITVLERVTVRSVRPDLLNLLHANDASLAAELLQDPAVRRRNRLALDWDGAWRLDGSSGPDRPEGGAPAGEAIEVAVRFAARIPVRPVRLIAEGFRLPRAEVERLIVRGKLVSAVRLSGKLAHDFTFLLKH